MLTLKSDSVYSGDISALPLPSPIDNVKTLCALSLRKLSKKYLGAAIRVRRSSDNAEADIGFVNNTLDTTSLLTFVGPGDGFVRTWYDQSGNNAHFETLTAAYQPKIVVAGVVSVLDSTKSVPAVNFLGQVGRSQLFGSNSLKQKMLGLTKLTTALAMKTDTSTLTKRVFSITLGAAGSQDSKIILDLDGTLKGRFGTRSNNLAADTLVYLSSDVNAADSATRTVALSYDTTINSKKLKTGLIVKATNPAATLTTLAVPNYIILGGSSPQFIDQTDYFKGMISELIIVNESFEDSRNLLSNQDNYYL